MKKIVVVGGGMSGCVTAIRALEHGHDVTIIERQEKLCKKIYLTGNGKCNLSNEMISTADYVTDNPQLLEQCINSYRMQEKDFWQEIGLLLKSKNGGIYPISNSAGAVVEQISNRLKELKANVLLNCKCEGIEQLSNKRFRVNFLDNNGSNSSIESDVCVLSCGGLSGIYGELSENGYFISKGLGLKHFPCYPALVQTKCKGGLMDFAGIRQDAVIRLYIGDEFIAKERGELQLTPQGLSGIAVFQLTLYMGQALRNKEKVLLQVDFLPDHSQDELMGYFMLQQEKYPDRQIDNVLNGTINSKIIDKILEQVNIPKSIKIIQLSKSDFLNIIDHLKNMDFMIKELNAFKNAQVSTGGVALENFDKNFMSIDIDNLYVTGEMLNVTGKCGGYNLFFAVASGYIVGENI